VSKRVKNITDQDIMIGDIGVLVEKNSTRDLSNIGSNQLANSDDLLTYLVGGQLVGNDGTTDLNVGDAVDMFRDYQQKFRLDDDDKVVVLPSHSTILQYNVISSFGDDVDKDIRGGGEPFRIAIAADQTCVYKEFKFVDDDVIFLKGAISFEDAGWGDYVSIFIVANPTPLMDSTAAWLSVLEDDRIVADYVSGTKTLAGDPVLCPNFENEGYWNYDTTTGLTFVSDTTGAYDMYAVEHDVAEVIKISVYGTSYGFNHIETDKLEVLPAGYFLRASVYNESGTSWKVWGYLAMYRTIPPF